MVLGGFVGGFGWFWVVPCFGNYEYHLKKDELAASVGEEYG